MIGSYRPKINEVINIKYIFSLLFLECEYLSHYLIDLESSVCILKPIFH